MNACIGFKLPVELVGYDFLSTDDGAARARLCALFNLTESRHRV
jgi:hypothetical protein